MTDAERVLPSYAFCGSSKNGSSAQPWSFKPTHHSGDGRHTRHRSPYSGVHGARVFSPQRLIALGGSVLGLFMAKSIRTMNDLRGMTTPKSHRHFYIYAVVVWLSFVPAEIFYLNYIDAREDPPFVDNMAIPIESTLTLVFGLIGLPVIVAGVWMVTRGKSLPVSILAARTVDTNQLLAGVIWIALVILVFITMGCLVTEPSIVPSCVCTAYLLLSGRAVCASSRDIKVTHGFEVMQKS
jgi:hypothetical protein